MVGEKAGSFAQVLAQLCLSFDFGKMSNCALRAAVFIAGSSVSVWRIGVMNDFWKEGVMIRKALIGRHVSGRGHLIWIKQYTSIFILEQAVLARIADEWRHRCLMLQSRTPFSHPSVTLNNSGPLTGCKFWSSLFSELELSWFLVDFREGVGGRARGCGVFVPRVVIGHKGAVFFGNNVSYSLGLPISCFLRTSYTTLGGKN